jgi:hypothetical protein
MELAGGERQIEGVQLLNGGGRLSRPDIPAG